MADQERIPVELVFNPNWWYKTAGISFDQDFYLAPQQRIACLQAGLRGCAGKQAAQCQGADA